MRLILNESLEERMERVKKAKVEVKKESLKEDNTENLGLDKLKLYKLLIKDSKDNTKWVTTAAFDEEKAKYYVEKGNAYYFNGDIPEVIEVREIKGNLQEDLIFDYTKEDVSTLKDLIDKEEDPIKKKYLKNALSKAEYETYDAEDIVKSSGELESTKEEETMEQDDSEADKAEEHPTETLMNNGIADMINTLIKSEFDAITDYNNAISTLISEQSNLDMIPVIEDILKEENNHVGMLQTILKQVSEAAHEIKGGEKEAKEIQASNE